MIMVFNPYAVNTICRGSQTGGASRPTRVSDALPDERACAIWAAVLDQCRRAGQRIQTADAWIAASALQWSCPLVTTDFRDYAAIEALEVVPIR